MQSGEFVQFETIMGRLEKVFSKKIDDETMQAYWGALKDQKLDVFRRYAERYEKHGKFFPKPSDLRAKEDRPADVPGGKADGSFEAAEQLCIRNLEELRKKDPEAHRIEVGRRVLDRIIATQLPGSSMYEAAYNEWRLP